MLIGFLKEAFQLLNNENLYFFISVTNIVAFGFHICY